MVETSPFEVVVEVDPSATERLAWPVLGVPVLHRVTRAALAGGASAVVLTGATVDEAFRAWAAGDRATAGRVAWGEPPAASVRLAADVVFEPRLLRDHRASLDPAALADEVRSTASYCARVETPDDVPALERALLENARRRFSSLDGWLERVVTRRFSFPFSRLIVRFPVTPNQVTCLAILVGLASMPFFAEGSYVGLLVGALLFQLSAVIDLSDGEIARLKLLVSPFGSYFDTVGDCVLHTLQFGAIGIGFWRQTGQTIYLWLGLASAVGTGLGSIPILLYEGDKKRKGTEATEKVSGAARGRFEAFVEEMGTRDITYYVLGVAAIGLLDWFLWVYAVGCQVFWVVSLGLFLRRGKSDRS